MTSSEIVLAIVAVIGLVLIILGIANHKKREAIYAEFKEYFGPVKAFICISALFFGLVQIILGIAQLFGNAGTGSAFGSIVIGIIGLALGVLLLYFTDKKAKAEGVEGGRKKYASCCFWNILEY